MTRALLLSLLLGAAHAAAPRAPREPELDCSAPSVESAVPFRGVGEATSHDEAVREARADADRLLCQGVDPLRCEALYQHRTFDAPRAVQGRDAWRACVIAYVDRRVYAELPGEDDLRAALARLGAQLPPGTTALDAVRWAGGCPAGPAGLALANHLVAHAPPGPRADDPTLTLELSVARPGQVHALLRTAGPTGAVILGDLEFDARFFELDTAAGLTCWDWRDAGLDGQARASATGLRLDASLSPAHGTTDAAPGDYCSGDRATLHVQASQDATAWAFALRADGTGVFMGQVPLRAAAPLDATLDLFTAGVDQAESIVLIGPSRPDAAPVFAPWKRPCRLPVPLTAAALDPAAALAHVAYTTHPAGDARCPLDADREARRREDEARYAALPVCGG